MKYKIKLEAILHSEMEIETGSDEFDPGDIEKVKLQAEGKLAEEKKTSEGKLPNWKIVGVEGGGMFHGVSEDQGGLPF